MVSSERITLAARAETGLHPMSFDLESDDFAQRRLQRLENRYRRAQNALAGARAVYGSLRELSGASELQLHQALQQVERAQRQLVDLQAAIELAEQQQDVA
jgi:chromosome segregation ATPase